MSDMIAVFLLIMFFAMWVPSCTTGGKGLRVVIDGQAHYIMLGGN